MNKRIIITIIGVLLISTSVLAQNEGPSYKQVDEIMAIKSKYPGKFDAFYSLTYKMTPEERELFQKTTNKLDAEKQFNDLMNQEKTLKEQLSKSSNRQIQSNDGRILTERQFYNEKLLEVKQKRIDAGVRYSVLKQEQAEEENKYYTKYQELFQKEEALRKKGYKAGGSIQTKDGRIMSSSQAYAEELEKIAKERIDIAKMVTLLSEDKYGVGGHLQLGLRKQPDEVKEKIEPVQGVNEPTIATVEPAINQVINQSTESTQSWGNAKPSSTPSSVTEQSWGTSNQTIATSNTNQNWGNATQSSNNYSNNPVKDNLIDPNQSLTTSSSSTQSWGNANQSKIASSGTTQNNMNLVKEYMTDQQTQNEVTTIAPGASKIVSQDLINLAKANAKDKNASFGTAIGEYISGIPENVLDEAYRMSSINGIPGTFMDNYNNNLLKLMQKYGISLNKVAIIQPKTIPQQQPAPVTAQANKNTESECRLPNGELDVDCLLRGIMPKVMEGVSESLRNIPMPNYNNLY